MPTTRPYLKAFMEAFAPDGPKMKPDKHAAGEPRGKRSSRRVRVTLLLSEEVIVALKRRELHWHLYLERLIREKLQERGEIGG